MAGIDDIGDLTIIDNGATVTVNYGTGSFTITNLADPASSTQRLHVLTDPSGRTAPSGITAPGRD